MAAFVGLVGLVAFLIGIVWLVLALIRRSPKRNPLVVMIGGVLAFFIGVIMTPSSSGQQGSQTTTTPASVTRVSTVPSTTAPAAPVTQNVPPIAAGSSVTTSDYKLTINNLVDPYRSTNQFVRPKEGNRYIAMEVTVEATRDVSVNLFYFKLKDSAGFQYDPSFITYAGSESSLSSIQLDAGSKTQGWISFESKEGSKLTELMFEPLLGRQAVFRNP